MKLTPGSFQQNDVCNCLTDNWKQSMKFVLVIIILPLKQWINFEFIAYIKNFFSTNLKIYLDSFSKYSFNKYVQIEC